jgi:phosphomannomutase
MPQLIVSISGIRGVVGDGLGPREAVRFGLAFGTHLGGGTVVMGRDSRPTGPMLAAALRAGLLATGCRVADVGILSTPGISVMVGQLGAHGGAIITASHNPFPYNGIKMLSPEGHALSRAGGQAVLDLYTREAFREVGADRIGQVEEVADAAAAHVEKTLGTVDAATIRARGFSVAVDAVCGAGGREMAMLLARLGCKVTMIHGEPTGHFPRGPEPLPENLGDLCRTVRQSGAALGLALDPDADRLALVDETGAAIGEEYTLALAARHRLTRQRGPIAANLSTSRLMDDVAREAGVPLHRTPVGEINVALEMLRKGCVIGGEGNGGVIDPRVTLVRDSLVGAALILEMMVVRGKSLRELARELPVYTMVKDKVPLAGTDPASVFKAVRARFADARLDERDGLHLSWDRGWLHIRASNTEPILRIMAEAADEALVRGWVDEVKAMAAGKA